jgi:hypothetical protein
MEVMGSWLNLLTGSIWIIVGICLLAFWKGIAQRITGTHESLWRRLKVPVGSTRVNLLLVRIILAVLAVGSLVAGFGDLYEFLTGREWPLRTAQWRDLWPF